MTKRWCGAGSTRGVLGAVCENGVQEVEGRL